MSKIFYAESIPDSVDKIAWTEICHGQQVIFNLKILQY